MSYCLNCPYTIYNIKAPTMTPTTPRPIDRDSPSDEAPLPLFELLDPEPEPEPDPDPDPVDVEGSADSLMASTVDAGRATSVAVGCVPI